LQVAAQKHPLEGKGLKMKVVKSSETSVNFYQTTKRNITEDNSLIITAVRTSNLTSDPLFNYRASHVPGSKDLKDHGL
jgi:hypothetical protein